MERPWIAALAKYVHTESGQLADPSLISMAHGRSSAFMCEGFVRKRRSIVVA